MSKIKNIIKSPTIEFLINLIGILIFLWLFLISIKLLGGTFKHFFKEESVELIKSATGNPLVSLFIGVIATAIIQSSSSTTSIIIAFVASGVLSFNNAIPMIMGANIGTSITGLIVSFGNVRNKVEFRRSFSAAIVHDFFNWLTVIIFLPLELMFGILSKTATFLTSMVTGTKGVGVKFDSPLDSIINPISKCIEKSTSTLMGNPITEKGIPEYDATLLIVMIIISLSLLFLSLKYMSSIMKTMLLGKFEKIIHKFVFNNTITSLIFGILFTISVQSSSITISIVVPLVGAGILTLEQIFPYAIGANIGTTITGILAALVTGQACSISIALVHTTFNIYGGAIFIPLKRIPIGTARWFSDRVYENRLWALGFIVTMYFIMPLMVILFS
ncbi:MAG: hypothetical protein CR982_06620 [Candidatus Cloacimonadota bacterium]|nr:MAG: hypothetical protein CR982_06620 [Candidatus Cloacimonadota bacterium]PIE77844.1 MAG: hypothetical protein CSA15_11145 [Candidatus Delongbacteria bacterium]